MLKYYLHESARHDANQGLKRPYGNANNKNPHEEAVTFFIIIMTL
jgi:hypothetical protein